MNATPSGADAYQAWIVRLREWGEDTSVSFDDLPPLRADSFSPATYQRFGKHLTRALQRMMDKWSEALSRSLELAHTEHEYQRALVGARSGLYARVKLSQHPGLPVELREELMAQTERDIRDVQNQLENAPLQNGSRNINDSIEAEQMRDLRRRNPLTKVLEPGYTESTPIVSVIDTITDQHQQQLSAATPPPAPVARDNSRGLLGRLFRK